MLLTSRWLKTCHDNAELKSDGLLTNTSNFRTLHDTDPLLATIYMVQTTFNCILDHLQKLFHYTVL